MSEIDVPDDEHAADLVEGVAHTAEPALTDDELARLESVATYLRGDSA